MAGTTNAVPECSAACAHWRHALRIALLPRLDRATRKRIHKHPSGEHGALNPDLENGSMPQRAATCAMRGREIECSEALRGKVV